MAVRTSSSDPSTRSRRGCLTTYDVALTWRRSAVRIRPDPFSRFLVMVHLFILLSHVISDAYAVLACQTGHGKRQTLYIQQYISLSVAIFKYASVLNIHREAAFLIPSPPMNRLLPYLILHSSEALIWVCLEYATIKSFAGNLFGGWNVRFFQEEAQRGR